MANSPLTAAKGPVDVSLESGGKVLASVELVSITVTKALNKLPSALIVLLDGDVSEREFPLSDGSDFTPGAQITIKAGYGGTTTEVFEGVVVRHRLRVSETSGSQLVIECRDKAYAMTLDRKNGSYANMSDSDVMKKLIKGYSGVSAAVTDTKNRYGEMVQYYCSDWDYVLARAEANGQVVIVDDGTITIDSPKTQGKPVLQVTLGEDVIQFDADIDARTQLQSVESVSWDLARQTTVTSTSSPEVLNQQGNLSGKKLANEVGTKTFRQQTSAALDKEALSSWSDARQLKAGLARIQGNVTFTGSADAKVGALIDLAGVGERFSGSVYLSRVEHRISAGEWLTVAEFGLPPEGFIESHDVAAPPASGWVPGVPGLHTGIVKKLDKDPDGQFRVQVTIPILGVKADGVWARLARFYASNRFGAFFVPEIGDEVLLGFMNDDPSQPVVLGSVYSSKLPAPYPLTADNNIKALVTRSNMKLEFDDDKKVITIRTPAGNQLVLSEDDKTVTLEDQNKNKMTMSPSGIDMNSPKDINIKADGNVSIDALGKIDVSARQDVAIKGLNVTGTADVGFTAKGGATAELSASGQTTIKGAMVMIN